MAVTGDDVAADFLRSEGAVHHRHALLDGHVHE
jgi:hypothetical protein